jgi:hypothetical protein
MDYERENICLFEGDVVWAIRWQRPECGCFMLCGFIPQPGPLSTKDLYWAMRACDEHDAQIDVVLHTMQTMPPSDEEMGHVFTRLLEAQIAAMGPVINGPVI